MFGQQQTSTPLQQTTGQQQQQRPTLVAFGQQYSNTPSSSTGGGLFGASTSSQQQQPQQPQQQQQPMFGAQSNAGAGGANATGSSTPFGASALFSQQHHQGTPQHQQQQPQQAQQQHQSPWGTASYPHQPAAASPFANNSSSFGATAGAPPSNAHAGMFGSPAHPQGAYQQQPQQYAFQQSQGQHLQQQQQPLPGQGMQLKDAPQPRVYMAGYLSSGAAHQVSRLQRFSRPQTSLLTFSPLSSDSIAPRRHHQPQAHAQKVQAHQALVVTCMTTCACGTRLRQRAMPLRRLVSAPARSSGQEETTCTFLRDNAVSNAELTKRSSRGRVQHAVQVAADGLAQWPRWR